MGRYTNLNMIYGMELPSGLYEEDSYPKPSPWGRLLMEQTGWTLEEIEECGRDGSEAVWRWLEDKHKKLSLEWCGPCDVGSDLLVVAGVASHSIGDDWSPHRLSDILRKAEISLDEHEAINAFYELIKGAGIDIEKPEWFLTISIG